MKSAWNLVGIVCWLIVIAYLIWMIHNMRVRRIKLIVTERHAWSWQNFWISMGELVIFLVGFGLMSYATFFQDTSTLKQSRVTMATTYKPLVIATNANKSYYVSVKTGNGRKPVQYYTYDVRGARYLVNSNNATISDGQKAINVPAKAYKWDEKQVAHMDKRYQKAWVGMAETTYKKTLLNGIGLHAGRLANRFTLIRVPDGSFTLNEE